MLRDLIEGYKRGEVSSLTELAKLIKENLDIDVSSPTLCRYLKKQVIILFRLLSAELPVAYAAIFIQNYSITEWERHKHVYFSISIHFIIYLQADDKPQSPVEQEEK